MRFIYSRLGKRVLTYAFSSLSLTTLLTLSSAFHLLSEAKDDNPATRHSSTAFNRTTPPEEGPSRKQSANRKSSLSNDMVRFSLRFDKQVIRLGEEINLTITAQLLNASPNSMFFLPGSNAYSLKMLLPAGFEQTGGTFSNYVSDELTSSKPTVTYSLSGRFSTITSGSRFRLLRGQRQASDQSLFVEKAILSLETITNEAAIDSRKLTDNSRRRNASTLYVISESARPRSAGARTAGEPNYRTHLDQANCVAVSGWVVDLNNPQQSDSVDIYINNAKVATVEASEARQDIATIYDVANYNRYGFSWVIPDKYKTNAPLTIAAKITGTSADLIDSPRTTLVCASVAQTTQDPQPTDPIAAEAPANADYRGFLDNANCNALNGWVMDVNNKRQSVSLDIYLNNKKVATITANQDRSDVSNAYGVSGFSRYGFTWMVPEQYKTSAPLTVSVKPAGTNQNLTGSPRTTESCAGTAQTGNQTELEKCRQYTIVASSVTATCGSSVTLKAECQGTNCDEITYIWTGKGVNMIGRQDLTVNAPTANGVESYTITATRPGCAPKTAVGTVTATGCATGAPEPQPQPQPTCSFTVSAASLTATCGSAVALKADCQGANCEGVTYTWAGNGVSQTGQSINVTAPSANGVYSYTVTATRTGCTAQTTTATVTVSGCNTTPTEPQPQPEPAKCGFTIKTTSVTATCGGSVTLKAECLSDNCDEITYTWSGNGISVKGMQDVSFKAPTTNGVTSYTVTATRPGCTPKTATGSVTVIGCATTPTEPQPQPQPTCSFTVSAASLTATCGSAVALKADCQGANCEGVTYTWAGNGVSQTGQSVNVTAPSANGVYSYTVTATRTGCTAQTTTATVTVSGCNTIPTEPQPQPQPEPAKCGFTIKTTSATTTCGGSATLKVECLSDNCDEIAYNWKGEGIDRTGVQDLTLKAPSTNGVYSYTATAARPGCAPKTAIATVTVEGCASTPTDPQPQPQPTCSFTVSAASLTATCGSAVALKADCQGANCEGVTYTWTGNGVSQTGQSVNVTAPSANGVYSYTVTATRTGCTAQTATVSLTVSGCNTTPTEPQPQPEPAKCGFTIKTTSATTTCGGSVTLKAECLSDNCDEIKYAWSGNGINQTGQQDLILKAPTTNGVYSYTVTATRPGCTPKKVTASVTVNGCASTPTDPQPQPEPANCQFTITGNTVDATCGGSVNLKADCQGANCEGITYTWSGNGVSQTGQTITINAPSANGSYIYTVTAVRNGCTAKTGEATVNVNGCTTTPTDPGPGEYPVLNSTPPADKRPVLQNERVRVAIDLGVGGVLREVTDLQVGENMINCMVKSDGKRDPGRDDQISLYALPDAATGWTQGGSPVYDDIGYNPVQGGDIAGNYSPVLGYGRTDKMLYCKTHSLLWGLNYQFGHYITEQWIRLEGNVVKRHVRITGNRPDQTRYDDVRQQELPCTYTNAAYYQYYVVQGNPYTGGELTNVNAIPDLTGSGVSLSSHRGQGQLGPYNINASEPWIVAIRPSNNRGIALHTPYSHEFKVGLFNQVGYGPPESSSAGYIANGLTMILDRNGVYEFDINMVVGTLPEIRNTINTLPRSETKPNYVFAGQSKRHGFFIRKGYDQGYPVGDELVITPTDKRFRFSSPQKGYKASEFKTIYVRLKAVTPETRLALDWRKVGQTELQAAQAGQAITFSIPNDGQYHTVAIPVGNSPQWSGIINNFSIRYVNPNEGRVNGQQFSIKWLSADKLE